MCEICIDVSCSTALYVLQQERKLDKGIDDGVSSMQFEVLARDAPPMLDGAEMTIVCVGASHGIRQRRNGA